MAKLSNKKIREIENISFVVDLIKKHDKYYHAPSGPHWTETPPEMWNESEMLLWDMMFENEHLLKKSIFKILSNKKQTGEELTYEERVTWFFENYFETGMELDIMLANWTKYDLDNFEWYDTIIKIPKYKNELE